MKEYERNKDWKAEGIVKRKKRRKEVINEKNCKEMRERKVKEEKVI